jgi:hypothetical protein
MQAVHPRYTNLKILSELSGDTKMNKIIEKNFSIQMPYNWVDENPTDSRYFNTIEEAVAYFKDELTNWDEAVIVQKVAIVRDADKPLSRNVRWELV